MSYRDEWPGRWCYLIPGDVVQRWMARPVMLSDSRRCRTEMNGQAGDVIWFPAMSYRDEWPGRWCYLIPGDVVQRWMARPVMLSDSRRCRTEMNGRAGDVIWFPAMSYRDEWPGRWCYLIPGHVVQRWMARPVMLSDSRRCRTEMNGQAGDVIWFPAMSCRDEWPGRWCYLIPGDVVQRWMARPVMLSDSRPCRAEMNGQAGDVIWFPAMSYRDEWPGRWCYLIPGDVVQRWMAWPVMLSDSRPCRTEMNGQAGDVIWFPAMSYRDEWPGRWCYLIPGDVVQRWMARPVMLSDSRRCRTEMNGLAGDVIWFPAMSYRDEWPGRWCYLIPGHVVQRWMARPVMLSDSRRCRTEMNGLAGDVIWFPAMSYRDEWPGRWCYLIPGHVLQRWMAWPVMLSDSRRCRTEMNGRAGDVIWFPAMSYRDEWPGRWCYLIPGDVVQRWMAWPVMLSDSRRCRTEMNGRAGDVIWFPAMSYRDEWPGRWCYLIPGDVVQRWMAGPVMLSDSRRCRTEMNGRAGDVIWFPAMSYRDEWPGRWCYLIPGDVLQRWMAWPVMLSDSRPCRTEMNGQAGDVIWFPAMSYRDEWSGRWCYLIPGDVAQRWMAWPVMLSDSRRCRTEMNGLAGDVIWFPAMSYRDEWPGRWCYLIPGDVLQRWMARPVMLSDSRRCRTEMNGLAGDVIWFPAMSYRDEWPGRWCYLIPGDVLQRWMARPVMLSDSRRCRTEMNGQAGDVIWFSAMSYRDEWPGRWCYLIPGDVVQRWMARPVMLSDSRRCRTEMNGQAGDVIWFPAMSYRDEWSGRWCYLIPGDVVQRWMAGPVMLSDSRRCRTEMNGRAGDVIWFPAMSYRDEWPGRWCYLIPGDVVQRWMARPVMLSDSRRCRTEMNGQAGDVIWFPAMSYRDEWPGRWCYLIPGDVVQRWIARPVMLSDSRRCRTEMNGRAGDVIWFPAMSYRDEWPGRWCYLIPGDVVQRWMAWPVMLSDSRPCLTEMNGLAGDVIWFPAMSYRDEWPGRWCYLIPGDVVQRWMAGPVMLSDSRRCRTEMNGLAGDVIWFPAMSYRDEWPGRWCYLIPGDVVQRWMARPVMLSDSRSCRTEMNGLAGDVIWFPAMSYRDEWPGRWCYLIPGDVVQRWMARPVMLSDSRRCRTEMNGRAGDVIWFPAMSYRDEWPGRWCYLIPGHVLQRWMARPVMLSDSRRCRTEMNGQAGDVIWFPVMSYRDEWPGRWCYLIPGDVYRDEWPGRWCYLFPGDVYRDEWPGRWCYLIPGDVYRDEWPGRWCYLFPGDVYRDEWPGRWCYLLSSLTWRLCAAAYVLCTMCCSIWI